MRHTRPQWKTTSPFLASIFLTLTLASVGRAQVYLNDSFADADRTNQALPASAAYFEAVQNAGATALTAAAGSMTLTTGSIVASGGTSSGGTTNFAIAYFAASGSPITLTAGNTITLSYSFTLTGTNSTEAFCAPGFSTRVPAASRPIIWGMAAPAQLPRTPRTRITRATWRPPRSKTTPTRGSRFTIAMARTPP